MLIVNRKSAFYLKSSPAEPNFFYSLPMGIIFLKMCPCCFPGIFGFIAFYKHNKTPSELDGWSNNYTSWVVKMHKSETSISSVMSIKPISAVGSRSHSGIHQSVLTFLFSLFSRFHLLPHIGFACLWRHVT